MKFLLVFPRFKYPSGDPPVGPLSLIAYLRRELPSVLVDFFDATFTPSLDAIEKKIELFSPDLVGVYCATLMYEDALKVGIIAKKHGARTVFGGPHSTMAPKSLLSRSCVDFVIIGEGERPLVHLLESYPDMAKIAKNTAIKIRGMKNQENMAKLQLIDDLDDLPFPAYDMVDMGRYIRHWFQMDVVSPALRGTNVFASRGCPFSCSFCQPTLTSLFGKKIRFKSPERLIEEILFLKEQYKINSFIIDDDTLTCNKEWLLKFCTLLEEKKLCMQWGCNTRVGLINEKILEIMSKVGYRRMMVGIESASQRILDEVYNKGIKIKDAPALISSAKEHGVKVFAYFMLGAPTETSREMQKTIDFAFTSAIDEATFSIATPLPGTFLASRFMQNHYRGNDDFSKVDYYRGNPRTVSRNIRSLRLRQKLAFLKFYLHPKRISFLLKSFSSIIAIRKSMLKLKRLVQVKGR
ncbi:radical SAM protein [Candidatus Bathyarchaeota archaeon]|nr:radical SAM protein [Candidatus Bathyarchaeota archaeon]